MKWETRTFIYAPSNTHRTISLQPMFLQTRSTQFHAKRELWAPCVSLFSDAVMNSLYLSCPFEAQTLVSRRSTWCFRLARASLRAIRVIFPQRDERADRGPDQGSKTPDYLRRCSGSLPLLGFPAPDDVDLVVGVDIPVRDCLADVDEVDLYGVIRLGGSGG